MLTQPRRLATRPRRKAVRRRCGGYFFSGFSGFFGPCTGGSDLM